VDSENHQVNLRCMTAV